MQEEFDDALKVEVLTSMLRMGKTESGELVEVLATRLQTLLPEITTIQRGGVFSNQRQVKQLMVRFPDVHLVLKRDKHGIFPQAVKVVRGVALKTTDVSLDDWISLLAGELSKAAEKDAKTREALSKFGLG